MSQPKWKTVANLGDVNPIDDLAGVRPEKQTCRYNEGKEDQSQDKQVVVSHDPFFSPSFCLTPNRKLIADKSNHLLNWSH